MGEGEDENTSGFDRASFRARNFGGPDSEDEAMLQDAVRWREPSRKPAKPTTVVRKAVIDDLWDQRGQLCRDWWEKAGSRKKLILNKIAECLDEECPRQWTGEYYLTDTDSVAEGNRLGAQLRSMLCLVDGIPESGSGE